VHLLVTADFAAQQLAELPGVVFIRQPIGDAAAAAPAPETQHEAGLLRGAAPTRQLQAERAMPAERRRAAMLDGREDWFPDQRAVREYPQGTRRLPLQQRRSRRVVLLVREVGVSRLGSGVRLGPLAPRHQLRSESYWEFHRASRSYRRSKYHAVLLSAMPASKPRDHSLGPSTGGNSSLAAFPNRIAGSGDSAFAIGVQIRRRNPNMALSLLCAATPRL
jgi:hypothetical protein